ncbi:stage III sporulation protein AF [Microaerobacter geothermalis]|uniref:stage III sporulation protein AF n=1 Tax=Microaerobacter geothermalis TaxID=674972 RepID=UPI001F4648E3|nr:stage III sporulation protein AF [Microaerobacter geothermalis]MCF6094452.1 stage III sporulation protein AF [Microaerobacter geothermalis]
MIALLSLWFKKIIILILLATFVDLLIPSSSYQRYIKFVVGLIIIVTILQPIFFLLKKEITPQNLSIDKWLASEEVTANQPDVSSIKEQGEKLKENLDVLIMNQVEGKIEQLITEEVENSFPVQVNQVDVSMEQKNGQRQLAAVSLLITQLNQKTNSTKESDTLSIQPVEIKPIDVHIEEKRESVPVSEEMRKDISETTAVSKQLRKRLSISWDIPPEQIRIQFVRRGE